MGHDRRSDLTGATSAQPHRPTVLTPHDLSGDVSVFSSITRGFRAEFYVRFPGVVAPRTSSCPFVSGPTRRASVCHGSCSADATDTPENMPMRERTVSGQSSWPSARRPAVSDAVGSIVCMWLAEETSRCRRSPGADLPRRLLVAVNRRSGPTPRRGVGGRDAASAPTVRAAMGGAELRNRLASWDILRGTRRWDVAARRST